MFSITYAAALLSIFLMVGAVAFLFSRRNTTLARTLALYCLTAAFWIGGNAAADISYTVDALVLASQVAYLGGALNLFLFLVLVDLIIDRRMPGGVRLSLYAVPVLGMSAFSFSDYAILDTHFPAGAPAQIVPGPLYLITLFILISALTYSVIRFLRALSDAAGERRRIELSYVLLGIILALAGEILFDVILPLMGELRLYTLGPVSSVFFVATCAYVILEHRLFDIRLALQRGMVYVALLTLIVAAYASLLSVVLFLSPLRSETAVYVSAGITTIVGILGTPFIVRAFTRFTDRIFFKDTYDPAEALHELSGILYRNVELGPVIEHAETALARILRANWVHIAYGTSGTDTPDLDALADGRMLAVPIRSDDSYVGSIHAGPKRSGDAYTARDQQLLETFALQAATAFSRAELYETTRQHARELEATVDARTNELRAAQAHERQVLIELSHNLQTPLAVFQTRLDQLKRAALPREDMRSLEQSMKRLSDFIYELLSLARLESNDVLAREHVDFSALVEEIAEEVTVIAGTDHVEVESEIADDIRVTGDAKRLREALLNIASNAVKYQQDGGNRRISFSLTRDDTHAILVTADTGRGIAQTDLPRVFDRFYRRKDVAGLPPGTGLGLAIAKRIIEQHGGLITLESAEGVGTTVTVRLPLTRS